jgi:hypothetical protein
VPSAISVNMFAWRLRTEVQARAKKGAPPQRTTGVASASCGQGELSVIASSSVGSASARLIHSRRLMRRSSLSSGACAPATFGSSAMPQIGQSPGWSCSTSGCIGQT